MSEIFYGGDGVKQRVEYQPLRGQELYERSLQATALFDEIFESGYALQSTTTTATVDGDGLERELSLSYLVFDKEADDFLSYDLQQQGIVEFEAKSTSYEKDVAIRHTQYRSGPRVEEYFVSFERRLPYIYGTFFHTFLFEFFEGGTVSVSVQSNNIDVDDGVEGIVFERHMSAYDEHELKKEIAEVMAHLDAGHREFSIDQELAKTIQ